MTNAPSVKVVLSRIVGSPFCVSIDDGQKVHDVVMTALESGRSVQISFLGVTRLTTAFLNAAIGQLYDHLGEERLRNGLLPPVDASQEQLRLLLKVVENAKRFFSDPERHRAILDDND